VILSMSSSFDSNINNLRFKGMGYAPTASFALLEKAYESAKEQGIPVKVGPILSSDWFYGDDPEQWKLWAKYGVLAVEMETAALYTLAAEAGVHALSILTVSDSLVTHEATTSQEREKTFTQMMKIALELA
jgi:purine-nucleoside phosphorylase